MTVLVVGGNGQLGAACCRELRSRGEAVRATVRDRSRGADLEGVELVELDLVHHTPADAAAALTGVDAVVLSANAVAPRAGDDVGAFAEGLSRFVDAAASHGVRRAVLPSVPMPPGPPTAAVVRAKQALELQLTRSPLQGRLLRLPPFMEAWFALVGSSLPLRGEAHATIDRPSPFLQRFRAATGTLVEDRGVMLVPGSPRHRHAFLSVADAARAVAEAAVRERVTAAPIEVAGPEVLSWQDVAALFADVLGRRVRVLSTPGLVYRGMAVALRPVAAVPALTMELNAYIAGVESPWTDVGGGLVDPATMHTAEAFLRAKAALPAA
ncbi:SDR family oxidoreductase [Nocardioides marmoribigeumensis]|uniref:Uncharacterized protein YbjT (DUF2867 family) n=1 Tax=Nocardioides marmoribigeumensis TaxID=433649 RepID=A0ABU2BY59_9ACTN|nr:NAD(P)H-binding protein [Nocardioides marmoribigeumensis]MDR7363337.1 uncharacterized protein YbjT (DUF2867 family) [Nocardioides marmoribigeumensis]